MSKLTIRQKIQYSMLTMAIALGAIIYFSIDGLNNINKSADLISNDTKKLEELNKIIVSHEKFVSILEKSLIENSKFKGQLDSSKCGLGKWWGGFSHSNEYKHLPSDIQNKLNGMIKKHTRMHNIAKEYNENYIFYDRDLKNVILQKEIDHLNWTMKLSRSIIDKVVVKIQTNSQKCKFGKWFHNYKTTDKFHTLSDEIKTDLLKIEEPHDRLHNGAKVIIGLQKQGEFKKATHYYKQHILKDLDQIKMYMTKVVNNIKKYEKNNQPLKHAIDTEAFVLVDDVIGALVIYEHHLKKDIDKLNKNNKNLIDTIDMEIIIVSIICILIFILMAMIVNGILTSINSFRSGLLDFFDYLNKNSTTVTLLDDKSNDEIGSMAKIVNKNIETIKNNIESDINKTKEENKFIQSVSSNLQALSNGNLKQQIDTTYDGEFITIKGYIENLASKLQALIIDINNMSKEHDKGDIDIIIPANNYQGEFATMANGINDMINGHITMNKLAIGVVEEFGNGNFDAPLEQLPGKKAFINDAIEKVRNNLKTSKENLESDIAEQTKEIESEKAQQSAIMNAQKNIVITTDGITMIDANKAFFDFYELKTKDEFINRYGTACICETFKKEEGENYLQKLMNGERWLDYVITRPNEIHKALITYNNVDYIFTVNAQSYQIDGQHRETVVFTDITDMEQISKYTSAEFNILEKTIGELENGVLDTSYNATPTSNIALDKTKEQFLLISNSINNLTSKLKSVISN